MMPIHALRLRGAGAIPPPPSGAYDPANKSPKIALSEANARMTLGSSPTAWNMVSCVNPRSSVLRQAELVLASNHYGCIGVVPSSAILTSEFATPDAGGVFSDGECGVWTSARLYRGGGVFANKNMITNTSGDALSIIYNPAIGFGWLARNGVLFEGDPITGASPSFVITSPGSMLLLGGAYEDGASNRMHTRSAEMLHPFSGIIGWDD